ncbi:MAG: hypothetical protein ACP5TG_04690 [Thermoplasmata archaeon]
MEEIHFEPKDGYISIFKGSIPNTVPSKYKDIIFERGKSDYFTGGLIRREGEWYIYIDKLKFLPDDDILKIVDGLKDEYRKLLKNESDDQFIEKEGKFLRRKLLKTTNDFFNRVVNLPGGVLYSFVMLGEHDTLFAYKFPEKVSSEVTSLLMEYITNTPVQVDLLFLAKETSYSEPSFFKLMKSFRLDYSKFILIKTEWRMTEEELKNENRGIFQNEMSFKPKYFDPDTKGLIGRMVAELKSEEIKGNVDKIILEGKGSNTKLVEFELKSKWFSDIYNDVLYPTGGSFFYWGYSNGKGIIENYYIIPGRNQIEFLKGLKKHWSEPSRAKHTNTITLVQNVEEVMKEYNFL